MASMVGQTEGCWDGLQGAETAYKWISTPYTLWFILVRTCVGVPLISWFAWTITTLHPSAVPAHFRYSPPWPGTHGPGVAPPPHSILRPALVVSTCSGRYVSCLGKPLLTCDVSLPASGTALPPLSDLYPAPILSVYSATCLG